MARMANAIFIQVFMISILRARAPDEARACCETLENAGFFGTMLLFSAQVTIDPE